MPRPPIRRFVEHIPQITYFKPAGIPLRRLQEVELTVDELEAVRLRDIEGLEQEEAAQRMGIARTTFRRVLLSARAKIAEALIVGKAIRIQGGPYATATCLSECPRGRHGHGRGRGWRESDPRA